MAIKLKTRLCKCGCLKAAPGYFSGGKIKGYLRYIPEHKPGARVNGKKKCTKCKQWLSCELCFYKTENQERISAECKKCSVNRRLNGYSKYGGNKFYWIQKRYGITKEKYFEILNRTNGLCPLCMKRPAVVVDHCHETGKVRGIVCNGCNRSIAAFGDTISDIQRVLAYFSN